MTDTVAKLTFAALVFLLVAGLGLLYVTSRGAEGTPVEAEFTDAFGVLEGLDVRVDGAPAGTVDTVELTDRGTSLVTMTLFEGVEPPRADASVSVRQSDLLGDTYVALDRGDAPEPLEGPISPERSVSAPRFDDILTTFREPVRDALGVLITETGVALDRRGADLNEALLRLRPGLEALDGLMTELSAQNGSLRSLIADAEHVTDQAERRSEDLGPSIDALATTLATTAQRTPELDAGLATAPETLARTRATLDRLALLTEQAEPAANALIDAAPHIERTALLLRPFLDDARATAADLGPTLDLARTALQAGEPTLNELAVAVPELRVTVPPLRELVDELQPASEPLTEGFFGADKFPAVGRELDEVGLGAVAIEPPDPADDPNYDPARTSARIAAVITCETFGVEIRPGCLAEVIGDDLEAAAPAQRETDRSQADDFDTDGLDDAVDAYSDGLLAPLPRPPETLDALPDPLERDLRPRELVDRLRDLPRGALDRAGLRDLLERLPDRLADRVRRLGFDRLLGRRDRPASGTSRDTLDFLLGP